MTSVLLMLPWFMSEVSVPSASPSVPYFLTVAMVCQEYAVSDQEEDDRGSDIRDLEFRLSHNLNQLQVGNMFA